MNKEESGDRLHPLNLGEITNIFNEAFRDSGYDVSVTEDEVYGAFYATDLTYNIYGFRSTHMDKDAEAMLDAFPPNKKSKVLVASLLVTRKDGRPLSEPPKELWAIDTESHEVLRMQEVYAKYRRRTKIDNRA